MCLTTGIDVFTFSKTYFTITVLILITEILIALFVHDSFIRPHFGDVLVVILIYCFIRSFLNIAMLPVILFVLCFSVCIEFLQYLKIVEILGLKHSAIARTVIGTSFAWSDLLAYVAGLVIILITERYIQNRNTNTGTHV